MSAPAQEEHLQGVRGDEHLPAPAHQEHMQGKSMPVYAHLSEHIHKSSPQHLSLARILALPTNNEELRVKDLKSRLKALIQKGVVTCKYLIPGPGR